MEVRKAIATVLLASVLLVGGSSVAVASDAGQPEYISGTPEGVKVWAESCWIEDLPPEPGMWDGEPTDPGRKYQCTFGIEVSAQYEQEHGPYSVPTAQILDTSKFREFGVPFIGVAAIPLCAAGEMPHYVGIAAAGEAGTYGADMVGFNIHLFDVACAPVNVYPPDPEPPVQPEPPAPEVPEQPTAPELPAPVIEKPAPVEHYTPKDPPAPRSVPETVKTDVGPVITSESALPSSSSNVDLLDGRASIAPTIRELLAMLNSAREESAPALSLPEPRSMPFSKVLEPTTFQDLWTIDDPGKGYSADGPRYFLAHTHTRGGAIGNAVNEADLTPGMAIEVAGVRYEVSNVSTVAKPDIGSLPIWQSGDPDDAFLIVCLWNNGSLATHNLVIQLHANGGSNR